MWWAIIPAAGQALVKEMDAPPEDKWLPKFSRAASNIIAPGSGDSRGPSPERGGGQAPARRRPSREAVRRPSGGQRAPARPSRPGPREDVDEGDYSFEPLIGRGALPSYRRHVGAAELDRNGGRVSPVLPGLTLGETQEVLQSLYRIAIAEYRAGVPFVGEALKSGRLRYIHEPKGQELFLKPSQVWKYGGGDCDDFAAAVAAEWTLKGVESRPVLRVIRPGVVHALVERSADGALFDPCITGGMLEKEIPRMRRIPGV